MSTDLMELASRVEAGEGPDRELDAEIWLHLPEQEGHAWKHGGDQYKHVDQIAGCSFVPAFTGSLDAAVSLVPKRWVIAVAQEFTGPWIAGCQRQNPFGVAATSGATSAARAATAAALRARAHQGTAHVEQ